MNFARACVLSLSLLAFAGSANIALANDPAAAQALFDKGKKLLAEGATEQACESFKESMRLDPGVGTKYQLGRCYETLGRTASAWSAFLDTASLAQASGQKERAAAARKKADDLEPQLSKLTVEAAEPAEGLSVMVGDTTMRGAAFGTAIPFDPGTHEVTAKAPNFETWTGSITVPANAASVTLSIPALKPEATKPKPALGTPAPQPASPSSGPQPLFWVGLGSGVLGIGSIVGGAVWLSNEITLYEEGALVVPGSILIGAGVLAAGAGTALMVLFYDDDNSASASSEQVKFTPLLSPTNTGVRIDF